LVLLQVKIGNAEYQCSCVRYVSADNIELIVGLSVGLGLLLIIVIIIIIVIIVKRRRRLSKLAGRRESGDNVLTSMYLNSEDRHYNRQLPDEYNNTAMDNTEEGGGQYDRQLPDDDITDEQL